MKPNQQQIKAAIATLSLVEESDISGMEADFSLAAMKFNDLHKNYLNKTIARDNAIDFMLAVHVPLCPKCQTSNTIVIKCPTVTICDFSFYASDKDKEVNYHSETRDECSFDIGLSEFIAKDAQHLEFKARDHLHCENCNVDFDAKEFLRSFWQTKVPFAEIVAWVNHGKKNRNPIETD